MKILSKRTDYYDKIGAAYKDTEPLYIREEVKFNTRDEWPQPFSRAFTQHFKGGLPCIADYRLPKQLKDKLPVIEIVSVGFCGKLYFGLGVLVPKTEYSFVLKNLTNTYEPFYYWEDVDGFFKKVSSVLKPPYRRLWDEYVESDVGISTNIGAGVEYSLSRRGWEKLISRERKLSPNLFREAEIPAWLSVRNLKGYDEQMVLNPILKDYQFYKLMDPTQAYQELDMFLGSVMAKQEDPDANKTDLIARDMAGFDEWSFKNKAPGEKKLRRKMNKTQKRMS